MLCYTMFTIVAIHRYIIHSTKFAEEHVWEWWNEGDIIFVRPSLVPRPLLRFLNLVLDTPQHCSWSMACIIIMTLYYDG